MPILRNNFSGVDNLELRDTLGVQFSGRTSDPADADLAAGRLYYNSTSGALRWYNGSSWATIGGSSGGASWETLFADDPTMSISTSALTIAQSGNYGNLVLTKTGTGAGAPLVINNAGTGDDLQLVTTRAGATGAVLHLEHDSASPADNDVVGEIEFNGDDSGGTSTEYGSIQVLSTDVTHGTEDASFKVNLFIAGTQRQVLGLADCTLGIGYGNHAYLTSTGAYNLVLETNDGTSSGTITITDGAAGAIALAPDTTGVVTVSTGIQVGGTTPTACTFATAGTTGASFSIDTATITSGTVLQVNHSSAATLSGGLLLDLQVASTSVFNIGETGATTIVGAAATDVFLITAGDVAWSDTSLAVTDADDAASLTVTNNTAATASMAVLAGSGTFTGSTTTSFFTVTPSGLTTGTAMYLPVAAITTGKGLHITAGATLTQGSLLYVQDTGNACAITSGTIATINETAATANANRSGATLSVSSTRTVTSGAAADDFDTASITRTETINGAGSFSSAGSVLRLATSITNTSGTITNTVAGLEVAMDADGTGTGVQITHAATAGRAIDVITSATTKDGVVQVTAAAATTGKLLVVDADALTTGYLAELSVAGAALTSGNELYISHASGNITATVNCITAGLAYVASTRTVTTGTVADDFDAAGIVRTSVANISGGGTFTSAGSVLKLTNTVTNTAGTCTDTAVGLEVSMSANGTGAGVSVTHAAASATGILSLNNALTTGKLLSLTSTGTGVTSGCLIYATSATAGAVATNGLVSLVASGNYTSATNAGALLHVSASATTAGYVATINAAAVTSGYALYVTGAGAYTGTGFVSVVPAGLTSGVGVLISPAALTTGKALSITGGTTLTSGNLAYIYDNSADTTARNLVYIHSDSATADMAVVPLAIRNDAVVTTNYTRGMTFSNGTNTYTIFLSNGTSPNGALSGTAGDLCIGCDSGQTYRCTGTTNWTAM